MNNHLTIPSGLKPLNTRDTKDWHKIMIERYNKINEEYKNNDLLDSEKNNDLLDSEKNTIENILTFEDADVFMFSNFVFHLFKYSKGRGKS